MRRNSIQALLLFDNRSDGWMSVRQIAHALRTLGYPADAVIGISGGNFLRATGAV